MSRKLKVGISQGDPNGIGPEIIIKSIMTEGVTDLFTPVVFTDSNFFKNSLKNFVINDGESRLPEINIARTFNEIKEGKINVIEIPGPPELKPGEVVRSAGLNARLSLQKAVEALKKRQVDVLVTAPICKENIIDEEFPFAGHTDYLEKEAGDGYKSLMILFDNTMRVALVTTHIPLKEISETLTVEEIVKKARVFDKSLRMDFGVVRPRIAILSLNPHNGEGGVLGREEEEIITPAIEELRKEGVLAFGPFAADGFFGDGMQYKFDGVLAMYHDQGLTPFKTLSGKTGVNFTAGLPFVRTSPDHGTAFEIAGKGIADEISMRNAIYEAIDIYRRRDSFKKFSANPLKQYAEIHPEREERQEGENRRPTQERQFNRGEKQEGENQRQTQDRQFPREEKPENNNGNISSDFDNTQNIIQ